MSYINSYSKADTSFWCNIAGLDTAYAQTPRICRWYLNGSLKRTITIPNGVSSGGDYQFTGLSPSTTYYVQATVSYFNGSVDLSANVTTSGSSVIQPPSNPRPSNWYWTSTIATGKNIAITASEWNNFCSRINAFRKYKGLSNYNFTTASKGAKIAASIVNQAHTAINSISGHGTMPGTAYTGSTITAYFFNQLANALNAIK